MPVQTDGKEIAKLLGTVDGIIHSGLDAEKTASLLNLIGCPDPDQTLLQEMNLYSEYLPMAAKYPFTQDRRDRHTRGRQRVELNHRWLHDGAFQNG